jgi:predicted  nucleic acid-binding Zn-ribbon protein
VKEFKDEGNCMLKELRLLQDKIENLEKHNEFQRKEIQNRRECIRHKKILTKQKQNEVILIEKEINNKKHDLKTNEEQVENLKINLNKIETNNEYSDLLKEISSKEKENYLLENEIVNKRLRLVIINKEHESLTEELMHDKEELKNFTKSVDLEPLYHYKRLYNIKNGKQFAEVSDNVCGGCFIKLKLQTINAIMGGKDLVICSNCKRILVLKEEV